MNLPKWAGLKMPKIFTVGDYMVYFWTHESTDTNFKIIQIY